MAIAISCPFCHTEDSTPTMSMLDIGEFTCPDCEETFTVAKAIKTIRAELERWERVAAWVEQGKESLADGQGTVT